MFIDVEWTKEDRGEEILKKEEFSLTNLVKLKNNQQIGQKLTKQM